MTAELSRRALLLGTGGLLLAGCGTPGEVPRTAQYVRGAFTSAAMKGAKIGWTIAYPKGHERAPLPVVLSLHGRGGDNASSFTSQGLGPILDDVVKAGTAPFAIASVDGGDHSYWHARADGTDPVAMLRQEFLPLLRRHRLTTNRLGLYGWSMGGYGSLLIAGRFRLPVRGVAVSSPALFPSAGESAAGAFDNSDDYTRNNVYGHPEWLDGVPLRVDCGLQDPFYGATRDFVGRLKARPAGGFVDGKHDATYWRKVAPAQLAFLGGRLSA